MGWTGREGKIAAASASAVAAAKVAAPVYGAVKAAEYLAQHSAMGDIEKAQAERRKRKEQGQP